MWLLCGILAHAYWKPGVWYLPTIVLGILNWGLLAYLDNLNN